MEIGRLNRRVSILGQSNTTNANGEQTVSGWETLYTVWGAISAISADQAYQAENFTGRVAYKIMIRWSSQYTLSNANRLQYTEATPGITHTYEIKAILNPAAGNIYLTFICYELNGDE